MACYVINCSYGNRVFYKSERAAAYVMKEEFMSTGQVGAAVLHPTNLWHRVVIRSLPKDGFVEVASRNIVGELHVVYSIALN